MSNPKVTIIIVTWNSIKYLPDCLKSIFEQTFRDFSVIIIDNGSIDDTVNYIKKNYPQIFIKENQENIGFAKANNQGISLANSEYALLCNQDIILEKDFLEKALQTIKSDQKIASVGGKLLKIQDLPVSKKPDIIDSCGIKASKSHYFKEIGANKKDQGQYNKLNEVFGISGALVLFKKQALEQIKFQEEYFDENYFSYKEDIDLAWRLRLAGYKSICNPNAVAYHVRSISKLTGRKIRPVSINQLSYKNHLLTIIKNQTLLNLVIYFPFILFFEIKKIIYILLLEQSTLISLLEYFKQIPSALKKRKFIMLNKKVSSKEIRKWFK